MFLPRVGLKLKTFCLTRLCLGSWSSCSLSSYFIILVYIFNSSDSSFSPELPNKNKWKSEKPSIIRNRKQPVESRINLPDVAQFRLFFVHSGLCRVTLNAARQAAKSDRQQSLTGSKV